MRSQNRKTGITFSWATREEQGKLSPESHTTADFCWLARVCHMTTLQPITDKQMVSLLLIKQPLGTGYWKKKSRLDQQERTGEMTLDWAISIICPRCCACMSGNHNLTFTHEEEVLCQSMELQKNFKVSDLLTQLKSGFTYSINISYVKTSLSKYFSKAVW